jgi:cytochrome b
MARVKVWDLPVRLVHWSLALLVAGAFITQSVGGEAMMWHCRIGIAVFGLLAFRITWGFVGSSHARFAQFVKGPAAIRAYLKGEWQGVGHNPLGALSVLGLLGVLAVMAGTGLFANDEIAVEGPLYAWVSADFSNFATKIHKFFEPLLIGVVALHVVAIVFYVRFKKDNIVRPMITGWKDAEAEVAHAGPVAFAVALIISVAVTVIAGGTLLPGPATAAAPATATTPTTPAAPPPAW